MCSWGGKCVAPYTVLDRMTDRHAEQPPQAQMLAGARARTNRHTEVQARILAEAHARMPVEARARTFILRVWACTEACDRIFLLKIWACTE